MGALRGGSRSRLSFGGSLRGAAFSFCEISGFGAVTAGFDEGLKAKLNLPPDEADCEPGPDGGGRFGVVATSPSAPSLPSPPTWASLDD